MLAMVVNKQRSGGDLQLPQIESSVDDSTSVATGLAPNEVYIDCLPHLPCVGFVLSSIGEQQSLDCDQGSRNFSPRTVREKKNVDTAQEILGFCILLDQVGAARDHVSWWVLPTANCVPRVSLEGSSLRGIRSAWWDQGTKQELGKLGKKMWTLGFSHSP